MYTRKLAFLPALVLAGLSLSLIGNPLRADETKNSAASAAPMQGGLLPGETREQKRERLLKGIEAQVGELTPAQRTHILAVLAAAGDEMAAARENTALTADQQNAVVRRVHGEISTRISAALTEAQQTKMKEHTAGFNRTGGWSRGGRTNETREQRRERLMKQYEGLSGLTVKQKSDLLAVTDASGDQLAAIRANTGLSEEEKRAALRKSYAETSAKVDAILTEAQRAEWQKVRGSREAAPAGEPGKVSLAFRN